MKPLEVSHGSYKKFQHSLNRPVRGVGRISSRPEKKSRNPAHHREVCSNRQLPCWMEHDQSIGIDEVSIKEEGIQMGGGLCQPFVKEGSRLPVK